MMLQRFTILVLAIMCFGGPHSFAQEITSFDSRVALAKKELIKYPTGQKTLKDLMEFPGGIEIRPTNTETSDNPDSHGSIDIIDGKLIILLKSTDSAQLIAQTLSHELVHAKDFYPLVSGANAAKYLAFM